MNDLYSPHTGEHITGVDPAPWMAHAGIEPPTYGVDDSAVWDGASWQIIRGDIIAEQQAYEAKMQATVSRAQGKVALMQAGLWDDVVAAVDAIADPTEKMVAEVALNEATTWKRGSPTMQKVSGLLNLTEQQMDDLYAEAQAIEL